MSETEAPASSSCFVPSPWRLISPSAELDWHEAVTGMLEHYTERTPGSFFESEDVCLTWHFADADPDFGMNQAKDMQLHFDQMLRKKPVRVMMAPDKKYLSVQPTSVSKGRVLSHLLNERKSAAEGSGTDSVYDFVLCIGDERDDEDMFAILEGNSSFPISWPVTVGSKLSRAQFYVEDSDEVVRALRILALRALE